MSDSNALVRAMNTLAKPAKYRDDSEEYGSTSAGRTKARHVLLDLYVSGGLPEDKIAYVRGALKHALLHNDLAPSLKKRIEGTVFDFEAELEAQAKTKREEGVQKRAKRERNLAARRERDRNDRLARQGVSGGKKKNRA